MELYINGTEYRFDNNYSIVEQAGSTAVMTLVIKVEDQDYPEPFDSVEIYEDGSIIFSGVVGIPTSPTYSTGLEPKRYTLSVQSNNAILRRRTVAEAYQEKTTTEIVQDLFENYIEAEGMTLGGISDIDYTYTAYTASRLYVGDVLDELAGPAGAVWHVDANKAFWFLTKDDFTTVDAPTHIKSLQKKTSSLDVRTVQIIQGATQQTSLQTESKTYVDDSSFDLTYPLSLIPTITINGTAVEVGTYGLDDSDTDKTFLWTYNSETVYLNSTATVQPEEDDIIIFNYYGYFSVDVELSSGGKIAEIATRTGTSGKIDSVITDASITSLDDATSYAEELLDKYGEADETITCETDSADNTDLLTAWTFDYPDIDIEGDYLIVKKTRSRKTGDKPKIVLQLKNKNYYIQYGTVYNDYDISVKKSSVRGDSVVIKTESGYVENLGLTGEFDKHEGDHVYYATDGASMADPGLFSYPFYPQGG